MKNFWDRYSYDVVKAFIFRFVVCMFALGVVSLINADHLWWKIVLTTVVVLLFMFLIYGEMWKIGAKDEAAGVRSPLLTGVFIGLLSSLLDFILAILNTLGHFIAGFADKIKFIYVIELIYNGMYRAILNVEIGGSAIGSTIWFYWITCLPAVIACGLGYFLGRKGWHLTKIFVPVNPEEKEVRAEEKKKKKGDPEE